MKSKLIFVRYLRIDERVKFHGLDPKLQYAMEIYDDRTWKLVPFQHLTDYIRAREEHKDAKVFR